MNNIDFLAKVETINELKKIEEITPDLIEFIIKVLKTSPELRRYFFENLNNYNWANIFYEKDFFKFGNIEVDKELRFYLLRYLVDTASNVPDIILGLCAEYDTEDKEIWHYLLNAILNLPANSAINTIDHITKNIDNFKSDGYLLLELVSKFIKEGLAKEALPLIKRILEPKPAEIHKYNEYVFNAHSLPGLSLDSLRRLFLKDEIIDGLVKKCPAEIVKSIENLLIMSLKMQYDLKKIIDWEGSAFWRRAIEDTGQDHIYHLDDFPLVFLRDLLEKWITVEIKEAQDIVRLYLNSKYIILRRVALHIIRINPNKFQNEINKEFLETSNYDNTFIHHEFFMLLQDCFKTLQENIHNFVLSTINNGPDINKVRESVQWWMNEYKQIEKTEDEYIAHRIELWKRDRFWMIKDYLGNKDRKYLDDIKKKYGEPDHPSFTSYSSGVHSVRDISPYSVNDLKKMDTERVIKLIKEWRPIGDKYNKKPSIEGFAKEFENLVFENPQEYSQIADKMYSAEIMPVYFSSYFSGLTKAIN